MFDPTKHPIRFYQKLIEEQVQTKPEYEGIHILEARCHQYLGNNKYEDIWDFQLKCGDSHPTLDLQIKQWLDYDESLRRGHGTDLSVSCRIGMEVFDFPKTRWFYVPTVDFKFEELTEDILRILLYSEMNQLPYAKEMVLYSSGRSYHGYVPLLLSRAEWLRWMGSLLLVDWSGTSRYLVDHRWVGHSLRRGYASLRWTCNSSKYVQLPERIGTLEEILDDVVSII